jgi:hypothetical protein
MHDHGAPLPPPEKPKKWNVTVGDDLLAVNVKYYELVREARVWIFVFEDDSLISIDIDDINGPVLIEPA